MIFVYFEHNIIGFLRAPTRSHVNENVFFSYKSMIIYEQSSTLRASATSQLLFQVTRKKCPRRRCGKPVTVFSASKSVDLRRWRLTPLLYDTHTRDEDPLPQPNDVYQLWIWRPTGPKWLKDTRRSKGNHFFFLIVLIGHCIRLFLGFVGKKNNNVNHL